MRQNEAEERLLQIWRDVLQVGEILPDANFFELSGNSLQATDLVRRVSSEFGLEITVLDIFDFPSFAEFADRVQEALTLEYAPPADAVDASATHTSLRRPSILQEESMRVDTIGAPGDHIVLRFASLIEGPLDVPRLSRTIELVTRRHELLRTAIGWNGEEAFLEISDEPVPLQVIDALVPAGVAPADHARAIALRRPDLTPTRAEPPLARFALLCLAKDLHALVVALDHMICDGSSIRLLVAEISKIYDRLSVEPGFCPDDVPVSFCRWAEEQRTALQGMRLARLTSHWRAVLGDDPGILSPPLPWSDLRPDGPVSYTRHLSDKTRGRIAAAARHHKMTPFNVGIAALAASLAEIVGPDRTCLTTGWENRGTPAHLQVFGPLAHDVYLRLRVDSGLSCEQRLAAARAAIHDALEHAEIPGLVLYRQLWPTSTSDPTLQPAVYVDSGERWAAGLRLDGTETKEMPIETSESGRDLLCEFTVAESSLSKIHFSTSSSGISSDFLAALATRMENEILGV
jgi:pristinamycin I synthase 3 and 4